MFSGYSLLVVLHLFRNSSIYSLFEMQPLIPGSNQVHHLKEKGPVAYSFSTRPVLGSPVSDKQKVEDLVVDMRKHKVLFLPFSLEQGLSILIFGFDCFAILSIFEA